MTQPSLQQLEQMLDQARIEVFKRDDAAFLATVLTSLEFQWVEPDGAMKTAATNGKDLFWNKADFVRCDKNEKKCTLIHEIWHPARLHFVRGIGKDPDIWNAACDYIINNSMVRDGYTLPNNGYWLVDLSFGPEMSEEQVYEILLKKHGKGKKMGHGDMIPAPADSAKQSQAIKEQIDMVIRAVQAAKASGKPGTIPGVVEESLDQFLNPVVPWKNVLIQWMTNLSKDRYTWRQRNRRFPGMYLPSRTYVPDGLKHLVFFVDTSASITDPAIQRFNSELKYILERLKPEKLTVIQFDTKIHNVRVFNRGDDFMNIKVYGRGGTSMVCVRDWIEKNQPTAAIIMSDMCCVPMVQPTVSIPILWAVIDGGGSIPDYGQVIHIKD